VGLCKRAGEPWERMRESSGRSQAMRLSLLPSARLNSRHPRRRCA
jgi:hypothetical protein